MIKAEIIADSKNEFGQRLTTFVVVFPRIVLAEFNTHRMLSRNSASSRAIPFEKMVKMVAEKPFVPMKWMKEHTGMQGNIFFTDEDMAHEAFAHTGFDFDKDIKATDILKTGWLNSAQKAVNDAQIMSSLGVTKQICNRLLEPFMYHTVIVTGSEWENFFALRAHPAAEIHIADLAHKMLEAYNSSTPKTLAAGQWHIPFGDKMDPERVARVIYNDLQKKGMPEPSQSIDEAMIKIATARCARVSYMNFDGSDDYQKDIELHDRLATMGHYSPFEHCAKAMTTEEYFHDDRGLGLSDKNAGWSGNFRGFIQYRKMLPNENRTDDRVTQK